MAKVKITNMLKFYALCLLSSGPKHGYELIKELEGKFGKKISASHVYPFLESLRKNKLIKFKNVGKRDKKVFHLTAVGRKFANDMFNKFGDSIAIAIGPRIATCPCGCRVYSGGHRERINGKLTTFCCSHCAKMHR